MNTIPSYTLEARAIDQRIKLQSSIADLKSRVHRSLELRGGERGGLPVLFGAVASLAALLGYFTGSLVRSLKRKRGVRRL